jgi:3-hydroxyacyl-CoA dehydrogenase
MKRRLAIQVARKAAQDYLECRTGKFLRKLKREDADAQMAFYSAAQDVAEVRGIDIDIEFLKELLELILMFIEALKDIFNW